MTEASQADSAIPARVHTLIKPGASLAWNLLLLQEVFDSAQDPYVDAAVSRQVYIDEQVGVVCGDASDTVSCESNYAQATDPYAMCGGTPCSRVLVATASNDTLIANTENGQLSKLLGQIDTYDEAALTMIAEDEIRHAQLSRELATFIEPQLSEKERSMLLHAQAAALIDLASELDSCIGAEERRPIGLPDKAMSQLLLAQLTQSLFPQASARV